MTASSNVRSIRNRESTRILIRRLSDLVPSTIVIRPSKNHLPVSKNLQAGIGGTSIGPKEESIAPARVCQIGGRSKPREYPAQAPVPSTLTPRTWTQSATDRVSQAAQSHFLP
jgi:hypothetical protein